MGISDEASAIIVGEVLDAMRAPQELRPFSDRFRGFELADAYGVVEAVRRRREARGERVVGRKVGFTNAAAWAGYDISGPIWNYLYDTTTLDLPLEGGFALGAWPNVRMETEVALGLGAAPVPGMDEDDLLDCIEWAALDEICSSIFPAWRFTVADAAATGVHVALLLGARHRLGSGRRGWSERLASFSVTLSEGAGAHASGGGSQVLGTQSGC